MNTVNIRNNSESNYIKNIDASQCLADHSPRDADLDLYHFAKELQKSIFETDKDFYKKSQRLAMCSNFLNFKVYSDKKEELHHKLHKAHFCRVRNCPMCQVRRSLLLRSRFFKLVPELPDNLEFLFLTFTVRNCEIKDLKETIALMNNAWKRIINLKSLHFPKWLVGWFRSIEVTRQFIDVSEYNQELFDDLPQDKAHPHFHILLAVKKDYFYNFYISQAKWTEIWKNALRVDYTPIVHIKKIKSLTKQDVNNITDSQDTDDLDADKLRTLSIRKAVLEVSKYSVKPSDFFEKALKVKQNDLNATLESQDLSKLITERDRYWFLEYCRQVHKLRFNASGGLFKELLSKIDEDYENGSDDNLIFIDGKEVDESELQQIADSKYTVNKHIDRYTLKTYSLVGGSRVVVEDVFSNSTACHREHVDRLDIDKPQNVEVRDQYLYFNDFKLTKLSYYLFDYLTINQLFYSKNIYEQYYFYKVNSQSFKFVSNDVPAGGGYYNNLVPAFTCRYKIDDIPF